MNRLYRFIRGYRRVTITGASPEWLINRISAERIPFWAPEWRGSFEIVISILAKDVDALKGFAKHTMCEVSEIEEIGLQNTIRSVYLRPVFLISFLLSISMILFLQSHLLFYEVHGNETVPSDKIIRGLERLGIEAGIYGANLDPKWVKDHILQLLPELQWITITQNGSMAQVTVRERPTKPEIGDRKGFANIIASHSGIITEQSVYEGQALKNVGDAVVEGELLVSGVVDLERIFAIVHAQADVFARTWRDVDVVMPQNCLNKAYSGDEYLCIWLEIGKRRIKIFGNSGISDTACDKIVTRNELALPGDHILPICIIQECFMPYGTSQKAILPQDAQWSLEQYALSSVTSQMQAGEIVSEQMKTDVANGCFRLKAIFECHEMISKTVEGKWKKEDFIQ